MASNNNLVKVLALAAVGGAVGVVAHRFLTHGPSGGGGGGAGCTTVPVLSTIPMHSVVRYSGDTSQAYVVVGRSEGFSYTGTHCPANEPATCDITPKVLWDVGTWFGASGNKFGVAEAQLTVMAGGGGVPPPPGNVLPKGITDPNQAIASSQWVYLAEAWIKAQPGARNDAVNKLLDTIYNHSWQLNSLLPGLGNSFSDPKNINAAIATVGYQMTDWSQFIAIAKQHAYDNMRAWGGPISPVIVASKFVVHKVIW